MIVRKDQQPGISLQKYWGIGREFMEVNAEGAERFMKWADMRYPVEVVSQRQPVSLTVTGKEKNHLVSVGMGLREQWVVGVDDKALAAEVHSNLCLGNDFDAQFPPEFSRTVARGLRTCLWEEKGLNARHFGIPTVVGWAWTAGVGLAGPRIAIDSVKKVMEGSMEEGLINATVGMAVITGGNVILNTAVYAAAVAREKFGWESEAMRQPFVGRMKPPDVVLPTMPLHRWIAGEWVLAREGGKLIGRVENKNL